jgi:hypothetical protein
MTDLMSMWGLLVLGVALTHPARWAPLPRGDFIDLWVGDGDTNCKHEYSHLSRLSHELLHQPYLSRSR